MISNRNSRIDAENLTTPLINDALVIKREYLNTKSDVTGNYNNYKTMIKELIDMGFQLEVIDMCLCFFNITTIDQAIQLLTKENNIWQHLYIEGDNKFCIICNEYSDHLNLKIIDRSHSFNSESVIRLKKEVSENSLKKSYDNSDLTKNLSKEIQIKFTENLLPENFGICKVCESEIPNEEMFNLPCDHKFCTDCWFYYLEQKIFSSEVLQITCMMKGCTEILLDETVRELLKIKDSNIYDKYIKFKINKKVLTDDQLKFCPELDCGGYAKKEIDKFVTCSNGHNFCFDCLKIWHGKKKCEELIEKDFEKWRSGKYIKKCPSCKFWTEKNEGCNHITCRACTYEWCWLCSGKYTSDHYSRFGPCNGLQFNNNNIYHNCFCRCLRRFLGLMLKILLGIGIFLLSLVFGSCILTAIYIEKIVDPWQMSKAPRVFLLIVCMMASLMFQPLLIILAIIIFTLAIILFPLTIWCIRKYL